MWIVPNLTFFDMCILPRGVKQCELEIVVADVRHDIEGRSVTPRYHGSKMFESQQQGD